MFIFQEYPRHCISLLKAGTTTLSVQLVTSLQLFTAGALLLQNSQLEAFDFFEAVHNSCGIDSDGPIPSEEGGVEIPQSSLHFSDSDLASETDH